MKLSNIFLVAITLALLTISLTTATTTVEEEPISEQEENKNLAVADGNEQEDLTSDSMAAERNPSILRGISRFLAEDKLKMAQTCDKNPTVCRAKGSPGPYCCKKKCVDVKSDNQNCGLCGKKCKYTETCCRGKCVNLAFDKSHCGGCGNKCNKGNYCLYGLCDYA